MVQGVVGYVRDAVSFMNKHLETEYVRMACSFQLQGRSSRPRPPHLFSLFNLFYFILFFEMTCRSRYDCIRVMG